MSRDSAPILCQWDITAGCNFSCWFCLSNSGQQVDHELTYAQARRIVDRLYAGGILFLRVLGGEPFYRRDIIRVLRYAAKKGMIISFSTNASLIKDTTARALKEIESQINYFQVSLYGTDRKTYEATTTDPKGFQLVQNGIRRLRKYDLDPTLFWVLTEGNLDQLESAYQLTADHGLSEMRVSLKLNIGRAQESADPSVGDSSKEPSLGESQRQWTRAIEAFRRLKGLVDEHGSPRVVLHARPLLGEYLHRVTGLPYFYITCKAASTMVYVDARGNCSPCPFASFMPESYAFRDQLPSPVSLLETDLIDIWHSELFDIYRRYSDPKVNPGQVHTQCPHFRAERCDPCIYTPCTCRASIRMIKTARPSHRQRLDPAVTGQ